MMNLIFMNILNILNLLMINEIASKITTIMFILMIIIAAMKMMLDFSNILLKVNTVMVMLMQKLKKCQ